MSQNVEIPNKRRKWVWGGFAAVLIGISAFNGGDPKTPEGAAQAMGALVVIMAGGICAAVALLKNKRDRNIERIRRQAEAEEEMARRADAARQAADQCLVLLYLAKSDGRMTRQERDEIVNYALSLGHLDDAETLDKEIRKMEDPGTPAYKASVGRLRDAPEEVRANLLASARAMVGSGKAAQAAAADVERLARDLGLVEA